MDTIPDNIVITPTGPGNLVGYVIMSQDTDLFWGGYWTPDLEYAICTDLGDLKNRIEHLNISTEVKIAVVRNVDGDIGVYDF